MQKSKFTGKHIVSSIRSPYQVVQSIETGMHIATIPFKTMEQLFHHPLTDIGIKRFCGDCLTKC